MEHDVLYILYGYAWTVRSTDFTEAGLQTFRHGPRPGNYFGSESPYV